MTPYDPSTEPDYAPVNRALDELRRGHIPMPTDLAALAGEIDRLRAEVRELRAIVAQAGSKV
jgi:hypothetical protein